MAGVRVTQSKVGPKSVPAARDRPQMVLGSRPPDMYAPRIKPLDAQRSYGKTPPAAGSNPATIGFGSPFGTKKNGPF